MPTAPQSKFQKVEVKQRQAAISFFHLRLRHHKAFHKLLDKLATSPSCFEVPTLPLASGFWETRIEPDTNSAIQTATQIKPERFAMHWLVLRSVLNTTSIPDEISAAGFFRRFSTHHTEVDLSALTIWW